MKPIVKLSDDTAIRLLADLAEVGDIENGELAPHQLHEIADYFFRDEFGTTTCLHFEGVNYHVFRLSGDEARIPGNITWAYGIFTEHGLMAFNEVWEGLPKDSNFREDYSQLFVDTCEKYASAIVQQTCEYDSYNGRDWGNGELGLSKAKVRTVIDYSWDFARIKNT